MGAFLCILALMLTKRSCRVKGYKPNPAEVAMLKECTARVRRYAFAGCVVGGISSLGAISALQRLSPMGRIQKAMWAFTGCFIGSGIGASSAGVPCMRQLVALQDSPMADTARSL